MVLQRPYLFGGQNKTKQNKPENIKNKQINKKI